MEHLSKIDPRQLFRRRQSPPRVTERPRIIDPTQVKRPTYEEAERLVFEGQQKIAKELEKIREKNPLWDPSFDEKRVNI